MSDKLVIAQNISFNEIDKTLTAIGWGRDELKLALPPIIPGEPELSSWHHSILDCRVTQTYNPVVGLRILAFSGNKAPQCCNHAADYLPTLGIQELNAFLSAGNTRDLLLGIFAAVELEAFTLLPRLDALRSHENDMVAGAATDAQQRLSQRLVSLGIEHLAKEQQRHPDRSSLFPHLGSAQERRQMLRWLGHDYKQTNEEIDKVLRSALTDADWEIRVTAMLVAARLHAVRLADLIASIKLPKEISEGINQDERRLLLAVKQCVIEILQGNPVPPQSDQPLNSRESMHTHITRCILGLPVTYHNHPFLFITAFCNPLPADYPMPELLPKGISEDDGRYKLEYNDISLVWIPPIPHWLGEQLPKMFIKNPIRQQTPEKGFFIGAGLFCHSSEKTSNDQAAVPVTCSYLEAQQICEDISYKTGLKVRLSTADEWEMAARGPDGRRFPWGNNANSFGSDYSPWGVSNAVGKLAQWTSTVLGEDGLIVSGGKKQWVCAQRDLRSASSTNVGMRIVVEVH